MYGTISVEKIIDAALLALWYANRWETHDDLKNIPVEQRQTEAYNFRMKATAYVSLLYTEIGMPRPMKLYKDIAIPEPWIAYFEERETKYKHPKEE